MAGTKIGDKMQAAIEKCSKECGGNNEPGKDNGKGKGKGKGMGQGKGKGKGKGSNGKGKGGKGKGTGKNSQSNSFECPKIEEIKEQFKEEHASK